ncbi:Glycoside hydrolase [Phytophthora cinnamomi]|uniref:Glycoside hydrolase n=1 Tax=Phytophthora cinnamomi TaxID=4785 RepID=UPI0035594F9E|nr:Glycoside hydrolase [Phytophthora cinnamomi]
MTSYILGQYDVSLIVKENVWYPVEIRVNSTAGNILFSVDGQQVFDIVLTEMGFTDDQLSFYGPGFLRAKRDGHQSDRFVRSAPMTDESVVVPEFGGQSNPYGACLDDAKRDRYIWLGNFYHTTRIMGVANSKPQQVTGTWEFLFEYQADYGQLPGFVPISYQSPMPTPEIFHYNACTSGASYYFPDYVILGLIGLESYMDYCDGVAFVEAHWEEFTRAMTWLVGCQGSNGFTDLTPYTLVFLGAGAGMAVNAAAVHVKTAINDLLWNDTLGNYALDVSTPEVYGVSAIAFALTSGHGYTDQAVFLLDNLWDAMISNESYRTGASWEYVAQPLEPGIDFFTSLSHPWGGAPTYALTNYIVGIRPVEFGFRRWIVNPLVTGLNVTSASATVSTPHGDCRLLGSLSTVSSA